MQPRNEEARSRSRTVRASQETIIRRQLVSNPTEAQRQERTLDEILTCWRWARSLDHRLNVYRLQFEHDVAAALDTDHRSSRQRDRLIQ